MVERIGFGTPSGHAPAESSRLLENDHTCTVTQTLRDRETGHSRADDGYCRHDKRILFWWPGALYNNPTTGVLQPQD